VNFPAATALIWAQSANGIIGADGTIPWHLPEDLRRFKELTWGHTVIMGRRTWDSLPVPWRPLPGRANLVLTRQNGWSAEGAQAVGSLAEAEAAAAQTGLAAPIWVVGGAEVYRLFLPQADRAEVTVVDINAVGDAAAPTLGPDFQLAVQNPKVGWLCSRTGLRYRFETWVRTAS
jgi:dihydrofolate reductase